MADPSREVVDGPVSLLRNRDELVGAFMFEVFPDNPEDPSADGTPTVRTVRGEAPRDPASGARQSGARRNRLAMMSRATSPIGRPWANACAQIRA